MSNGGNVDDEFFRYSLIEAVRVRPQLWMKSATKIRGSRRQLTSKLWAEVGSITNRPGAECRKIFKNLIDVKRSNDKKLKNGFLAETKPKWKYYEVLNFLNVKGSRLHKRYIMEK
uniref:MADF domain-containing protein n=1 Tax=Romanomermis culicivorax TaxID=13658 RepID=A0A915KAL4_ROMCU